MQSSNRFAPIFAVMLLLHTGTIISSRVVHAAPATTDDFIRSSCSKTLYPAICLTTLAPLAPLIRSDPVLLASTALNASLAATVLSASSSSGKTTPGAMKVCTEELADAVDELRRSVVEMATLGGEQLGEQVGNIQTWVSAALTDVGTCLDGLRGGQQVDISTGLAGSVGGPARWRVAQAAQMTSNALYFINNLVAH